MVIKWQNLEKKTLVFVSSSIKTGQTWILKHHCEREKENRVGRLKVNTGTEHSL